MRKIPLVLRLLIVLLASTARGSVEDRCRERSTDVEAKQQTVGFIKIGTAGYCSATLLAPKVVLTAAHCVAGSEFRKIVFANLPHIPAGDFPSARITAIRIHPQFSTLVTPGKARADLALLQLDSTSYGTPPKKFYGLGSVDPVLSNTAVVLVGYGIDPKGVQGVRREKHVRLEKPETSRQVASGVNVMRVIPGEFGAYPCKGDSGAPLLKFVADRMSVLGVYSWQTQMVDPGVIASEREPGDVTRSQYECRTSVAAFATLLPAYRDWIVTTARQLDTSFYTCSR